MWRQQVSLALILFIFLPIKLAIANTLEITPTLYFFNYQEFDQNDVLLDKEQGALPGIKLSYADDTERDSLKFMHPYMAVESTMMGKLSLVFPTKPKQMKDCLS